MPDEKQYTCGYCKETPVTKEHVDECRAKATPKYSCPVHGDDVYVPGGLVLEIWTDGKPHKFCGKCVQDLVLNSDLKVLTKKE